VPCGAGRFAETIAAWRIHPTVWIEEQQLLSGRWSAWRKNYPAAANRLMN